VWVDEKIQHESFWWKPCCVLNLIEGCLKVQIASDVGEKDAEGGIYDKS
jgi:hypothetical protein